ncbi:MAG TPA: hypothetical protein VJZ00_15700, partial [Thermoanaerobaculia bacterium]|nr:hypothetical protein [Thermoanaerobaculia bacterium]
MPEFLALVAIMVAIAALVSARRARADVLELRRMILRWQRPVVAPEPVVVPPPPPPVVVAPEIPPPPPPAPAKPRGIDWENVIGIKLFSWIAGIAL